jgi:hypothetical protein
MATCGITVQSTQPPAKPSNCIRLVDKTARQVVIRSPMASLDTPDVEVLIAQPSRSGK